MGPEPRLLRCFVVDMIPNQKARNLMCKTLYGKIRIYIYINMLKYIIKQEIEFYQTPNACRSFPLVRVTKKIRSIIQSCARTPNRAPYRPTAVLVHRIVHRTQQAPCTQHPSGCKCVDYKSLCCCCGYLWVARRRIIAGEPGVDDPDAHDSCLMKSWSHDRPKTTIIIIPT